MKYKLDELGSGHIDVLKIHAQAGLPPIPSIFDIAAYASSLSSENNLISHWLTASRPPNAPETVAAEKNNAARMPNSERLYQLLIYS